MRSPSTILALVLVAASTVAASGQQAAVTSTPKTAPGISLAYDPVHSNFTASGFQLKSNIIKRNTASAATTGTVNVTVNINIVSKFRHDTYFPCSAIVIGGILDLDNATIDGGVETAYGVAQASGDGTTATCNLTIPYSWTLASDASADSGLIIAFAAGAVDRRGNALRTTTQISGIENLPATGTTSSYTFNAAL
jgi:hypothetical protein